MQRSKLLWLLPLGWALGIFYLSTLRFGPETPSPFPDFDKVVHLFLFGGLAWSTTLAGHRGSGWSWRRAACVGFCFAALYGGSDEIHQMFTPTRTPDVKDWMADSAGALTVFLPLLRARRKEAAPHAA